MRQILPETVANCDPLLRAGAGKSFRVSWRGKLKNLWLAKIQIPDKLKQDLPPSKWGKILAATPIVMTVIATMLAGLASSEMTKAQYDRASAAQLQSKAGDQWSFYQAKKLRGAVTRNTLDLLAATSDVKPLDAAALPMPTPPPLPR